MRCRRAGLSRVLPGLRTGCGALIGVVAPWSVAGALVVSFTAAAGESTLKVDHAFRGSSMIEPQRLTLMPPRLSALALASLRQGPPDPGLEANAVLPHIRKVDLARDLPDSVGARQMLFFITDRVVLPDRRLDPATTAMQATDGLFERLGRFDGGTLAPGMHGGGSGDVAAQGASPHPALTAQALAMSRPDGSTPAVSRAVRLGSVTPAPVEPEIIAAAAMRIPAFAHVHGDALGRPVETATLKLGTGYFDVVSPESLEREQKCLAEAIYFEARSEPEAGQAAVAQVVLNRVRSGLYPTNVCGVVYQNRHKYKACQFSFACEGRSLAVTEAGPWAMAQRIAREVMAGASYNTAVGASTHYHANYVAPYWSRKLKRTDRIGRHIFYELRPGQT